jgi:hypothetical protein
MPDEDEPHQEAQRKDLSSNPPKKILIIGIPALIVSVIAVLLGIPWWIVLIILAVFGLMIITNG